MPLRDESRYNINVKGEPSVVGEIRQKILAAFNELVFVEDGHKYYLNGKELCSVSSVAAKFEEPFDTELRSKSYAAKHGETPQYWADQWRFTNLKATITGTQVHSYAESMAWIHMGHPENITDDNKYKFIADKGWLIPTRRKEESVLKYWKDVSPNYYVVLPETRVYTKDYAGTFDLLLWYEDNDDPTKSGLIIRDWKTNGEIYKDYSRKFGKMLKEPFNSLYDEPFGAYAIQQSCYQIPMEDIGLKILDRQIIWLKEDGSYEIISLPNVTDIIRKFFNDGAN